MSRKAQGISINVIIIAAIALLVLVILATLLYRQGVIFQQKLKDCGVEAPGSCHVGYICPEGQQEVPDTECSNDPVTQEHRVCCNPFTAG